MECSLQQVYVMTDKLIFIRTIVTSLLFSFRFPDDKCLVFMTTKTSRSHIELVVPSKATLRQFTISIWIKVPANGQGAVFSYMVNGQMVLGLLMKPSKQRSDFFLAGRNL